MKRTDNVTAAERYMTKIKLLGNNADKVQHWNISIENDEVVLNGYVIQDKDSETDHLVCKVPDFIDIVNDDFDVDFTQSFFKKISIIQSSQRIANLNRLINIFQCCTCSIDLQQVNFDSCTTLRKLFSEVIELEEITLGYGGSFIDDTSWMCIRCKSLRKIDFNKMTLSHVRDIQLMFKGCENLRDVDLSSFKGQKVESASSMLNGSQIEHIDLSPIDWQNLSDAYQMLGGSRIKTADLRCVCQTVGVEVKNLFFNCKDLEEVWLGKIQSVGVYSCYQMFADCVNLEQIHFDGFTFKGCEDTRFMFDECHRLKLDNFRFKDMNTDSLMDMTYMFNSCQIRNLDMSGCKFEKLRDAHSAVRDCNNLETVNLSEQVFSLMSQLSELLENHSIKQIDLHDSCFESLDTQSILEIIYLPSVIELNLNGTRVTKEKRLITVEEVKEILKQNKKRYVLDRAVTIYLNGHAYKI